MTPGERTFWAEAPGFVACFPHLAEVVVAAEDVYPGCSFALAQPAVWMRVADGRWRALP